MNASSLHKVSRWFYDRRIPYVPKIIGNIIFLLYNSYIPASADIGKGTVFAYGAMGVVLHSNSKIGSGCVIGQGVTIGAAEGYYSSEMKASPVIGNNCYLAAGSKIIGGLTIGDNCIIGAGSIVLSNVPDNSVVVGSPARVIRSTELGYLAIR